MRCPECEMNTNSVGKMKKFRRGIPSRGYGTCKVCRYVVSEDFVGGFWTGVKYMEKKNKED
jgi:hypothetical protein